MPINMQNILSSAGKTISASGAGGNSNSLNAFRDKGGFNLDALARHITTLAVNDTAHASAFTKSALGQLSPLQQGQMLSMIDTHALSSAANAAKQQGSMWKNAPTVTPKSEGQLSQLERVFNNDVAKHPPQNSAEKNNLKSAHNNFNQWHARFASNAAQTKTVAPAKSSSIENKQTAALADNLAAAVNHYDAQHGAGALDRAVAQSKAHEAAISAQANARVNREFVGLFAIGPLGGLALATAPISTSLYGYGSTGFYATSITLGGGVGGATEFTKNRLLNERDTIGGYASAIGFGALGGTGFSFIAPEAKYITSLSRFSGVSAERIASAGNGFVFGAGADFLKQSINLGTGVQARFSSFSILQGGAYSSVGGATLPRYYGFGAQEQLNIATYRAIYSTTGRAPIGATPSLILRAGGETQLPVTIGQSLITPGVEIGVKRTMRVAGN